MLINRNELDIFVFLTNCKPFLKDPIENAMNNNAGIIPE